MHRSVLLSRSVPLPHIATIRATGPDTFSWLDHLCTQQLTTLSPGTFVYSLLLDERGTTVSDLVILVLDQNSAWIGVPQVAFEQVFEMFDQHLIMEDVELEKASGLAWRLHLPSSPNLPQDGDPSTTFDGRWGQTAAVIQVERGPQSSAGDQSGSHPDELVTSVGLALGVPWLVGSILRGRPAPELSVDHLAISLTKGCYLGQEIVARTRSSGSPWSLCRLLVRGEAHQSREQLPTITGEGSAGAEVVAVSAYESKEHYLALARCRTLSGPSDSWRVDGGPVEAHAPAWGPVPDDWWPKL